MIITKKIHSMRLTNSKMLMILVEQQFFSVPIAVRRGFAVPIATLNILTILLLSNYLIATNCVK